MKYPTQSTFNLETELDISANDKILKSPFYIALKNSVIPTFPPLFSESHSPLRDLDPKSVCPPITIVCSKYYFSVTFQHICHKGSNKPPFEDISIFIERTSVSSSKFSSSSQRHSSCFMSSSMTRFWLSRISLSTICCCVIAYKRKMPLLVRTAG